MWGWTADHSLDGPERDPPQNIAVGRGALVESAGPTWLVGTSFEHCTLYQYALRGARDVYVGQQQTEAPYWQGVGTARRAPAPWAVNGSWGDPGFGNCAGAEDDDRCYRAWGVYMVNSSRVVVHGSAMWSFFNGMDDGLWSDPQCGATGGICQTNMAFVEGARATWWFSVSSKAAENLVVDVGGVAGGNGSGTVITSQKDNPGSWGAVVAAYLRNTGGDEGEGDGGQDSGAGRVKEGLGLFVTTVAMLFVLMFVELM